MLRPGLHREFCHSSYTNSVKASKRSVDTGYCAYAEIAYFNLGSGLTVPDENLCIPVITAPTLSVIWQLRLGWRGREWEESRKRRGGF